MRIVFLGECVLQRFLRALREALRNNRVLLACLALGFAVSFTVECMGRGGIVPYFSALLSRPGAALESALIVSVCLIPCLFLKRKIFFCAIVCVLWLGLGVANVFVLGYRVTPLSFIDFAILQLDWSFIGIYMSLPAFILLVVAVLLLIAGLIQLFRKSPRSPRAAKRGVLTASALLLAVAFVPELPLPRAFDLSPAGDVLSMNEEFGFIYTFSRSLIDRGIDRPEDYSARRVHAILRELDAKSSDGNTVPDEEIPNVIFLQLESFFDVNHLKGVTFAEDPLPYFGKLKDEWPSGFFVASSVGAGTANTEFEVLTQMNVHDFGTGEYPYVTVLQEETCESLAYLFHRCGLQAHALHNNTATFYDRNTVFPMLGFDSFTSVEYMNGVELNEVGWAKDAILTGEIEKLLDSTPGRDFIYTISVQPHGAYPEESESRIPIVSGVSDPALKGQLEYYASQIREVDDFLRDLTAALKKRPEPVVLVLYGDHMPSLDLDPEDLDDGSRYTTEYVIWANDRQFAPEKKDVHAYQLASLVMERIGRCDGTLTKFHQTTPWTGAYETELLSLQYDMLYGDRVVYGGENPFAPSKMRMGTEDVYLSRAVLSGGTLTVTGENFTPYSVVVVDGEPRETAFVSPEELTASAEDVPEGTPVSVRQIAEDGTVLSSARLASKPGA